MQQIPNSARQVKGPCDCASELDRQDLLEGAAHVPHHVPCELLDHLAMRCAESRISGPHMALFWTEHD